LSQVVRQVAEHFPAAEYADVLVGLGEPDDAAVYRLDDARALIKTTDFFTPIVDDPWTYGAIAAANSMSDVYAMGGEVLFCLNIAGFPEDLNGEIVAQIFAGGAAKVREAGGAIAGGHTVTNPEPFYGLSVTGLIHPARIMRKGGARPGDRLFLTKPLGTGIVTTAAKLTGSGESRAMRLARRAQGKPDLDPAHLDAAIEYMLRLNQAAAQAAQAADVRAASDITGFGLLGHGAEMAIASGRDAGAGLRIRAAAVPALPGVWAYIAAGYLTRGSQRNPAHFGEHVRFAESVTPPQRTLLWEVETSGGLLLAVPPAQMENFQAACAERNQDCWEIGEVVDGTGVEVI
jgi:selenide,water dikinase